MKFEAHVKRVGQSEISTNNFDLIAASGYDDSIPEHVMRHLTQKRLDIIQRVTSSGIILDVGCGTGRLLTQLSNNQYKRFGIDISGGMLHQALHKDNSLHCSQASATIIPYQDNTFDIVFCAAVLHHLAEPSAVRQAIREMIRVTKTGGIAIIWDHNPRNPYWPIIMRRVPQDIGEERLIPKSEIQTSLENLFPIYTLDIHWYQLTFIPDFVPAWSMPIFGTLEYILERTPIIRNVSAHNVAIVHKK